jgi:hypothetical protein
MGWFGRKPSWEDIHAKRIYDALVASEYLGDIPPLGIPTAANVIAQEMKL